MVGPVRTPPAESAASVAAEKNLPAAPRPPNAWILYRSDKLKELPPLGPDQPRRAQADVSRLISTMWKNETEETRAEYERRADEKKAEHAIKYPNYRFQPMKKEDKAALREQRKHEKEQERKAKQQRARQVSSGASSIPIIPHTHLYPPMVAGSLYYPMETFGMAGPSPPISASSSPKPNSSPESASDDSHDITLPCLPSIVTHYPTQSLSTNPTPYSLPPVYPQQATPSPPDPVVPSNPYSAYYQTARYLPQHHPQASFNAGHCALSLYNPSSQINTHVQTISSSNQTTPLHPSSSHGLDSSMPVISNEQVMNSTFSSNNMNPTSSIDDDLTQPNHDGSSLNPSQSDNVSFVTDINFIQAIANFMSSNPGAYGNNDNLDAFLLKTDDPAIFQLPNLDPEILISNPSGELEVSFGHYPLEFDFDPYLNFDPDSLNFAAPQISEDSAEMGPIISPNHTNVSQYLPLDCPSVTLHPAIPPTPVTTNQNALTTDLSNTDNSLKPNTLYVPPGGAAHSSTRRVAGSWKPSFAVHDSAHDNNNQRPREVPAN